MHRRMFLTWMATAAAAPALAHAQTPPPRPIPTPSRSPTPAPNAQPTLITPQNELERSFIAALRNADARPLFRRELMVSQIAVAFVSNAPDAAPREVAVRPGLSACAIFTSVDRLNGVLGPTSGRRVMRGRDAFALLRGRHVVLNYQLAPMLTLEPEDVAQYLDGAPG